MGNIIEVQFKKPFDLSSWIKQMRDVDVPVFPANDLEDHIAALAGIYTLFNPVLVKQLYNEEEE